ncbi:VanZ family protein [Pimelobacter simplex]|uniref:VanZ family protein n=1 Tax=Nocardioides simplex TaxID=2045 RepID=A0A7J5E4Z8_NOCSI|nr:VanZ family protein [Pimelobacter simplex]KAB2813243.1 VanZ family protein [Pimelobacter simplex]
MSDQLMNGVLATALGSVVAVVLLLPVAAVEYRRDGRLSPRDLLTLLAVAVYGLALWTYTLLPMPVEGDFTCVGRQTTPFDTIGAIAWGDAGSRAGLSALVRDPAFLQVALNVLLFVPLGYFVRRIARRGVVVATVLGFAVSLLIETTQTTGVWHLYDCAYRLFDVDDLILNTLGATAGSLVAAIFIRRTRPEVVWPTSITFGRRMIGMVCDVLFVVLTGAALVVAYRAFQLYVVGVELDDLRAQPQRLLQWGVPAAVEAAAVLLGGRTVGEWAVAVRAVARRRPALLARLVKLLTGVGPLVALMATPQAWSGPALLLFGVVTVAAAVRGREHRGLSHTVAGMDLEIVQPRAYEQVSRPG